jgi:hypothetical protein
MLEIGGGMSIPESENFVDVGTRLVMDWSTDRTAFAKQSGQALASFEHLRHKHSENLRLVAGAMLSASEDDQLTASRKS